MDELVASTTPTASASARAPLASDTAPGDADERLTTLEERMWKLESRAWSLEDLRERGYRLLRPGLDEATLVQQTERALDTETSEEERLEAFRALRGQLRDDATDARLPALAGMLELARTTDQPAIRAGIYRELVGLVDPALVDPLVESMRGDATPEVRIAAARSLATFRAEP